MFNFRGKAKRQVKLPIPKSTSSSSKYPDDYSNQSPLLLYGSPDDLRSDYNKLSNHYHQKPNIMHHLFQSASLSRIYDLARFYIQMPISRIRRLNFTLSSTQNVDQLTNNVSILSSIFL